MRRSMVRTCSEGTSMQRAVEPPRGLRSRRRLALTVLVVGVALAVTGAVASAKWTSFRAGNVVFKFDGGVVPKALPRHDAVPVGVAGRIAIATTDGSHAPALRGGVFEGDRNVVFNAAGLPTCPRGRLEASTSATVRRLCGGAIVGGGKGTVEIVFPESRPIVANSPLIFFNGGTRRGQTTFFVHAYITVPVPAAIVTTVKFKRVRHGRYGLRFVTEVPKIAGGAGSITKASFTLRKTFVHRGRRRSYLNAKCPDGRFLFRVLRTDFEADGLPASVRPSIAGAITRPCTPRR